MGAPTTGHEIAVDRIRCDGFGMCAELLPELIELDDWGYPIVAGGSVPDELLDHARRAVAVCPVLALRLRPVARATMKPRPRRGSRLPRPEVEPCAYWSPKTTRDCAMSSCSG